MLKGDAVQSFTMMFLQMWNVTERQPEDYGKYAVPKDYEHPQSTDHSGFVLPYGDSLWTGSRWESVFIWIY